MDFIDLTQLSNSNSDFYIINSPARQSNAHEAIRHILNAHMPSSDELRKESTGTFPALRNPQTVAVAAKVDKYLSLLAKKSALNEFYRSLFGQALEPTASPPDVCKRIERHLSMEIPRADVKEFQTRGAMVPDDMCKLTSINATIGMTEYLKKQLKNKDILLKLWGFPRTVYNPQTLALDARDPEIRWQITGIMLYQMFPSHDCPLWYIDVLCKRSFHKRFDGGGGKLMDVVRQEAASKKGALLLCSIHDPNTVKAYLSKGMSLVHVPCPSSKQRELVYDANTFEMPNLPIKNQRHDYYALHPMIFSYQKDADKLHKAIQVAVRQGQLSTLFAYYFWGDKKKRPVNIPTENRYLMMQRQGTQFYLTDAPARGKTNLASVLKAPANYQLKVYAAKMRASQTYPEMRQARNDVEPSQKKQKRVVSNSESSGKFGRNQWVISNSEG